MLDRKAYILQNHNYLTAAQMAEDLGVRVDWVYELCEKYGVEPISPREQGIAYVKIHHEKKTPTEMANALEVSMSAVYSYMRALGLSKGNGKRRPKGSVNKTKRHKKTNNLGLTVYSLDEKMIAYVRANIDEKTKTEIAEDLGVSFETVHKICQLNNIKPTPAKEGDLDYFPPFEQMGDDWHDALLEIAAAALGNNNKNRS